MKPLIWLERAFEESGDVRTWTHVAAVPGGWLIRVSTYVKTKYGAVSVSQCMEYVPGILEHAPHKKR
jgi:hypothetical protein